jgi:hypothetical protein
MTKLNWKQQQPSGRYRALGSRPVGGVYWIDYTESFAGSYHHSRGFWVRSYRVEHAPKGGGGYGNLSQVPHRTLEDAKAVAEFHHEKMRELLRQHGDLRSVPDMTWYQLNKQKLAFEERLSADMLAEIEEKRRRLDAGWEGEPGRHDCPL